MRRMVPGTDTPPAGPLATLAALAVCSVAFAMAVCGWMCALLTLAAWPVTFVVCVFALFAREMRRHHVWRRRRRETRVDHPSIPGDPKGQAIRDTHAQR